MDVIALDGRGYAKFLAAGTYFLRKYRQVLNDLNVFPVPDGDTGTNMYLTIRAATLEASKRRKGSLAEVAALAAQGSLMGARGNSGVIISQMLRGFAHHVRHRGEVDTFAVATAMREAVSAAKAALLRPVEGTIISVAEAAAEAAYRTALHEPDFYRFVREVLRAANDALDRTPEQLPVLKEAGVVDSGGAGFVYFLEGILAFLPEVKVRASAFPRRPERRSIFTPVQRVGEHKYCTEFVLAAATCDARELRHLLEGRGESLLVIGEPPTLKVHVHTDDPAQIQALGAKYGTVTRVKVDDMERQHTVLIDRAPSPYAIVSVADGEGLERIFRELGSDEVVAGGKNPSVRDLLLALNKTLADHVYLLLNDPNVALAAGEAAALCGKRVTVVPTHDPLGGIAVLFAFRLDPARTPDAAALEAAIARVRGARLFFAGKDATLGGASVARGTPAALYDGRLHGAPTLPAAAQTVLAEMGAADGGLITLYYGGVQKERDTVHLAEALRAAFPQADVEYYYGGMKNVEYWLSLDV